ncbi:MAG: hypothetical protein AAFQ89_08595 [Cyanobacteria bacterium J06626_18]
MAITLSEQNIEELYQDSVLYQPPHEGYEDQAEVTRLCPQELGTGYRRWIQLRDINLLIHNYELRDDVTRPGVESSGGSLEFGFRLSGNCAWRKAGQTFCSMVLENWGFRS